MRRRRRAEPRAAAAPIAAGEIEIRADRFQAFVGGASIDLTRREFELIELLAEAEGRVLEREEIYQRVWGYAMARGDRSVDVFVRKLRQKLEKCLAELALHPHALRRRLPLRARAGGGRDGPRSSAVAEAARAEPAPAVTVACRGRVAWGRGQERNAPAQRRHHRECSRSPSGRSRAAARRASRSQPAYGGLRRRPAVLRLPAVHGAPRVAVRLPERMRGVLYARDRARPFALVATRGCGTRAASAPCSGSPCCPGGLRSRRVWRA